MTQSFVWSYTLAAVVDAAQPLVRVFLLEDREEPVPVLPLLVAAVAARPPDRS